MVWERCGGDFGRPRISVDYSSSENSSTFDCSWICLHAPYGTIWVEKGRLLHTESGKKTTDLAARPGGPAPARGSPAQRGHDHASEA